MALRDKVNAVANASAPAEGAPVAAPTQKKVTKTEAFKQQGASIRAQMSEEDKALEGSKSDKVAFVCALGDPNRKQARVEQKTSKASYVVVGYKFKALEDMTVPFAPLRADWKTILDTEPVQERQVKAGTVFALNIVETAHLISKLEYAGKFSGEGTTVTLSAKTSADREEPLPVLNKVGAGSIKENMELIADMVGATATNKGTPKIKEEFAETLGNLYAKKSLTKKSAGASRRSGEGQADIAAAFRNFYKSK